MMFVIGIVLFALAILISVALHECGHMGVALATGMKVRRYFVGFGPTLWSTRRGETEYGVKAIPAGGFCDIAGMTSVEELAPDERDRAMYKQKTWKRVAVLFAGPGANFIIGLVLIYAIAVVWGLPNLHPSAVIGQTACAASEYKQGQFDKCTGDGPAAAAGIRAGDVVLKVGDTPVTDFSDMAAAVQKMHGTVPIVIKRDGQTMTKYVDIAQRQRWVPDSDGGTKLSTIGVMGVVGSAPGPTQYNVITAVPATFAFTGNLSVLLGKSLVAIPTKIGALVHAIGGGQRSLDTPISVVGASIIGGDTVDHGVWMAFWLFLAQLNFILGVINLLPLLPFDGGHIAIAVFEKLRNMIRSARGMVAAAPVNYLKLMPATYVVLV
ncbi:M50 family metallopeptidase, partial [Mycobacterium sp.]|uniref:M50 family metallopeptidase n=1 Tax=Mycobacterium sp. TaxID=1785 RepID=UPI003C76106E